MSIELDYLDKLAASVFDGYPVRKDLVPFRVNLAGLSSLAKQGRALDSPVSDSKPHRNRASSFALTMRLGSALRRGLVGGSLLVADGWCRASLGNRLAGTRRQSCSLKQQLAIGSNGLPAP